MAYGISDLERASYPNINRDTWLCKDRNGNIKSFNSKEEADEFARWDKQMRLQAEVQMGYDTGNSSPFGTADNTVSRRRLFSHTTSGKIYDGYSATVAPNSHLGYDYDHDYSGIRVYPPPTPSESYEQSHLCSREKTGSFIQARLKYLEALIPGFKYESYDCTPACKLKQISRVR